MIVTASITGLFRMLLIIIGALVVIRFLGQLMNAKRNMEDERLMNEQNRKFQDEKRKKTKDLGKTRIVDQNNQSTAEDVDFEEVD